MDQEMTLRELGAKSRISVATLKRWKAEDPDFPGARRYSATCVRYSEHEFVAYMARRSAKLAVLDQSARMKALRAKREEKREEKRALSQAS